MGVGLLVVFYLHPLVSMAAMVCVCVCNYVASKSTCTKLNRLFTYNICVFLLGTYDFTVFIRSQSTFGWHYSNFYSSKHIIIEYGAY